MENSELSGTHEPLKINFTYTTEVNEREREMFKIERKGEEFTKLGLPYLEEQKRGHICRLLQCVYCTTWPAVARAGEASTYSRRIAHIPANSNHINNFF